MLAQNRVWFAAVRMGIDKRENPTEGPYNQLTSRRKLNSQNTISNTKHSEHEMSRKDASKCHDLRTLP